MEYIQEIVPSLDSISNLIIGEAELQTISALSNRQNSKTKQWSADFIEGKGTGQIILLHGGRSPGVVVSQPNYRYRSTRSRKNVHRW